jgi:hypothetical protein
MPGKKERLNYLKTESLAYLDLSPSLSKASTLYAYLRLASDPAQSLISLLEQIIDKAPQATLIVDKLEMLVLLLGR